MSMETVEGQLVGEPGSDLAVPLDQQLAEQLMTRAKAEGLKLVGPGGLLADVTRRILQAALEAELSEHLGYDKGDPAGRGTANSRNGHSDKTVRTDLGPIPIRVPRDRRGGVRTADHPEAHSADQRVQRDDPFVYAKGLTTGEIQAHLAEVYEADVSRELISQGHRCGQRRVD